MAPAKRLGRVRSRAVGIIAPLVADGDWIPGEAIADADGHDEIRQDRSAGRDVSLVDGPGRKVGKKARRTFRRGGALKWGFPALGSRSPGPVSEWGRRVTGVLHGGRGWLVAHVEDLPEMRLRRLDRIEAVDLVDRGFVRQADFDLREYGAQAFGVF
jgi:hypothetical protein